MMGSLLPGGHMRVEPKQVLLNLVAGWRPAYRIATWLGEFRRPPDLERIVNEVLERFEVRRMTMGADVIRGADMLEIGSGREFGLALLLVHQGARRVVNVEIEPLGFIRDSAFYRLLVERARARCCPDIAWPPAGLRESGRVVRADPSRIAIHLGRSAAAIPEGDESFDVTFSVSVLQHVRREALADVAAELYRVTRPGGMGFHRIDFRDLESSDPLRHLCFTDAEYRLMYQHRRSYTNRYRLDDYQSIFQSAGFAEVRCEDVRLLDESTLETWMPRLDERFRRKDPRVLLVRSCMLVVVRS